MPMLTQRRKVARSRNRRADVAITTAPVVDLDAMSWNELRSYASDRGVLGAGMTRAQVVAALGAA